jgi:hypothetical protein
MDAYYSTGQVAKLFGIEVWKIRRVLSDGSLPLPPRFCGKRAIPGTMLPAIVDALRERGWLDRPTKGESL